MRRAGGYATISEPGKRIQEADTFTCIHCNSVVIVPPKASASDMGGWCMMCAKPVCKRCAGKGCSPFLKQIEKSEARDRMLRAIGV